MKRSNQRAERAMLVDSLVAICAAARLRNATRIAEAPRLVGERRRRNRHDPKEKARR